MADAKEEKQLAEARALVQAAELAEAEKQAQEQAEKEKPYQAFKDSPELATVLKNLTELRKKYVGEDEAKFARLNSLHQLITHL